MIRLLKRFADYLDSRFPPKLFVTVEAYADLMSRVHSHAKSLTSSRQDMDTLRAEWVSERLTLNARAEALEDSIAALKDFITKQSTPGAVEMKRRADFIGSGRMTE